MENIEIDEQKTEFIQVMGELNKKFAISPVFFSVLLSLVLEHEGASQERIMELSGYSRGKISETLQDLLRFYPIKKVKLEGIRTKVYKLDVEPEMLMIALYESLSDTLSEKILEFEKLMKKIEIHKESHERFTHLHHLLSEYTEYLGRSLENAKKSRIKFHEYYAQHGISIVDEMSIPEISVPRVKKSIDKSPFNRNLHKSMTPSIYTKEYLPLKEEFFKLVLATTGSIMPLKKMVARGRIMMELAIEEQYLSKKDIERATGYKSTIIQQVLNEVVDLQAASVKKFDNDKKKYYIANNRLLTSSFRKYEGVKGLVQVMISTINTYKDKTNNKEFESILQRMEDGYKLYSLYLKYIYYNLEESALK